jgi:Holliday junction resolvase RusA-like endonuclease
VSGWQDAFKDKAISGIVIQRGFGPKAPTLKIAPKRTETAQGETFGPTPSGWWLPYPPSSNDFWGHTRTGQTYLKPKGRAYKEHVKALTFGAEMLTTFVRVELEVVRPRRSGDLDNFVPMVLDALQKRLWLNDSQIVELHAWRMDDADNPGVMVRARQA